MDDEENPSELAGVDIPDGVELRFVSRSQVVGRGIFAVLVFSAVTIGLVYAGGVIAALPFIVYCVIAPLVHPTPDEYTEARSARTRSDLALQMLPGNLIATSVVDLFMLIRTRKLPHERALDKLKQTA